MQAAGGVDPSCLKVDAAPFTRSLLRSSACQYSRARPAVDASELGVAKTDGIGGSARCGTRSRHRNDESPSSTSRFTLTGIYPALWVTVR